MFEREHHLRIATVLQSVDADLLSSFGALFGGGTAIVLAHGEYRESADIDFLVSDQKGYRELRQRLTGADAIGAIARPGFTLTSSRDLRADQYGVRTMLLVSGVEIKFEIVFESRVELQQSDAPDRICGVAALTRVDMATTKLLANSDRWADDGVFCRDLIDLAMIDLPAKSRQMALAKARDAYGEAIDRDLANAIARLKERRGRLAECMIALKIDALPEAVLWARIRKWKPAAKKRDGGSSRR